MTMKRIDNPEEVEFSTDDGFLCVFDMCWNRLDSKENPIICRTECEDWHIVSLAELQRQYGDLLIVVFESHLNGSVYRLGNYSDGLWYEVGSLAGFA